VAARWEEEIKSTAPVRVQDIGNTSGSGHG
jgi:hypothetical protein